MRKQCCVSDSSEPTAPLWVRFPAYFLFRSCSLREKRTAARTHARMNEISQLMMPDPCAMRLQRKVTIAATTITSEKLATKSQNKIFAFIDDLLMF